MSGHQDELDNMLHGRETPDRSVIQDIEAKLTSNLVPVTPIAVPAMFALLFTACLVAVSVCSLLVLRSFGWSEMDLMQRGAVFGSLCAVACVLSLSLARQMVPGSKVYVNSLSLLSGAGVFLVTVFACCFGMEAEPHLFQAAFFRGGLVCLQIGTPFAVPTALLLYWIARRGFMLSEQRVFTIVGVLSGLVSAAILELHCPNFDLRHILAWHLGIPLLGAVVGFGLSLARR